MILNRGRQCQTAPSPSRPVLPAVNNVPLPQGWTAIPPGQDVAMVTVQPGSAQYNHVQTEFKKTLSGRTIHKIERMQNIDLWESYSRYVNSSTVPRASHMCPGFDAGKHGSPLQVSMEVR